MASDEEDLELDDLAALQRELDALKQALGSSYRRLAPALEEEGEGYGDLLGAVDYEEEDREAEGGSAELGRGRASIFEEAPEQTEPTAEEAAEEEAAGVEEEEGALASPSAAAVRAALEANRALQARLLRLLRSTDRAMDRNADMVARLKALDLKQKAALAGRQTAPGQQSSVASWFWQVDGQPPPPHPEALELAPLAEALPLVFKRPGWTEDERQRLREGVLQLVQEVQLNAALSELQAVVEGGGAVTLADYEARSAGIAALTVESPEVAAGAEGLSPEQWAVLLQRAQLVGRSVAEAQAQWHNAAHPMLLHGPFSPEEDTRLEQVVEELGTRQWAAVSQRLGGCRTPLACLSRYQQLRQQWAAQELAAGMKPGRLGDLDEGDFTRLEGLVKRYTAPGGRVQWKLVALSFGTGWNGDQLMHIWRRRQQRAAGAGAAAATAAAAAAAAGVAAGAAPHSGNGSAAAGVRPAAVVQKRGRWSPEEDELLLKAMALHQRKWSKVALLVPGRSDVQCRERFMNVLNPEVKAHDPWTEEEDAALEEAVAEHTNQESGRVKWSAVAAHLPGRTDALCMRRWKALQAEDAKPKAKQRKRPLPAAKQPAGESGSEAERPGGEERAVAAAPRRARAAGASARKRKRRVVPRGEKEGEEGEELAGATAAAAAAEAEAEESSEASEGEAAEEQTETETEGEGRGPARPQRRSVRPPSWQKDYAEMPRAPAAPAASRRAAREEERRQQREERQQERAARAAAAQQQKQERAAQRAAARQQQRERAAQLAAAAAQQRQERAERQAAARQRKARKVNVTPPASTLPAMPSSRQGVVGRRVLVWWIVDEDTGEGKLYNGQITGFDQATGQHTIEYEEGPEQHTLEEETVVWGTDPAGPEVTGPGTPWPEDSAAPAQHAALQGGAPAAAQHATAQGAAEAEAAAASRVHSAAGHPTEPEAAQQARPADAPGEQPATVQEGHEGGATAARQPAARQQAHTGPALEAQPAGAGGGSSRQAAPPPVRAASPC